MSLLLAHPSFAPVNIQILRESVAVTPALRRLESEILARPFIDVMQQAADLRMWAIEYCRSEISYARPRFALLMFRGDVRRLVLLPPTVRGVSLLGFLLSETRGRLASVALTGSHWNIETGLPAEEGEEYVWTLSAAPGAVRVTVYRQSSGRTPQWEEIEASPASAFTSAVQRLFG